MLKFSILLVASMVSIVFTCSSEAAVSTPGAAAPVAATGSTNIVQPLEDKQSPRTVMTSPIKIESVTSGAVCGTTLNGSPERVCLGENSGEVSANDTVSKLQRFIIGSGNLCGVDERGVRCWATQGKFEKRIQTLLATGDSTRIRFGSAKFCLPQTDKTIRCYSAEEGEWVASANGKDNRYVRKIPPTEVYGPYADLRDFRVTDSGICALEGEHVICETSPNSPGATMNVDVPRNAFKGARSLSTIYGVICVLGDGGLDCVRDKEADVKKYHVEGLWTSAVRLFDGGYDSLCGVDKDDRPICVKLGEKEGDTTDTTPTELFDPATQIVKFRASGDARCALVENKSSHERSLLCSSYGKLEPVALARDAVDFEVSADGTCVRNVDGRVNCFTTGSNLPSPLPEDGSPSKTAGPCRWNNSRFHCASTDATTDFSDIKVVLGATATSDELPLPCVIYENRAGLHSVRCFGSAERLVTNAPELKYDNLKITANYEYACAYGGETTECWGSPLGGENPPVLSLADHILFGRRFGCAKDQFGFVCWGSDLETRGLQVPRGLGDLESVSDFAVGAEHVCAITREKKISCWGDNRDGQLDAPTLTDPVSIGASGNTTCASSKEGVTCWGTREGALLGQGQSPPNGLGNENLE